MRRSQLGPSGFGLILIAGVVASCGGAPQDVSTVPSAQPAAETTLASSASPAVTPLPAGVTASIPLLTGGEGYAPTGVAIGFGSVWVETHRGTSLYRIDPGTNEVIATIDVGQEACGAPAAGAGRLWLGPCDGSTRTILVDPATNQITSSLQAFGGCDAFTRGAAWLPGSAGELVKVDASTYRIAASYHPFPGGTVGCVGGDGREVWAADEGLGGNWLGKVARIDPATGAVVKVVSVESPGQAAFITMDGGFLWVKGAGNERVYRVSSDGSVATYDFGPGNGPTEWTNEIVGTGMGSVWLRLLNNQVIRIDERTGKSLGTYPADPASGGGVPAIGFGSLWLTNSDSNTIWRDQVTP
jgi:hypothetical protein